MLPGSVPFDLLQAAVDTARFAYAPYSRFAVGAAVETADGSLYVGANMENASYGLTLCAEIGALQAACSAGKMAHVVKIAVVGGPNTPDFLRHNQLITPCGRCRQLILECAFKARHDIEVWCASPDLTEISCHRISELLPQSFSAADLNPEYGKKIL